MLSWHNHRQVLDFVSLERKVDDISEMEEAIDAEDPEEDEVPPAACTAENGYLVTISYYKYDQKKLRWKMVAC